MMNLKDNKKNPNKQAKNDLSAEMRHFHFDQLDSTNSWAKRELKQWAKEGITLVTASEQTAGRGRFNRKWSSPANLNLYASFCFWFPIERLDLGHLSQLMALTAVTLLKEWKAEAKIKWPNDLLIKNKKIGGILCETFQEDEKRAVICGIGLNINMEIDPADPLLANATSLLKEIKTRVNGEMILMKLKEAFSTNLALFIRSGFSPFLDDYKKHSFLIPGQRVKFATPKRLVDAQFLNFTPEGSLELFLDDGRIEIFPSGELIEGE